MGIAESLFVDLAKATALQWGPTPEHMYFYRSPTLTIVEFFVEEMACVFLFLLCKSFYADAVLRKPPRAKASSNFESALGMFFLFCWVSQVIFKSLRPNAIIQLMWILMPCHIFTLLWAFIFLSNPSSGNYNLCVYLASFMVACHWGPVGGIIAPDWTDHQFKLENYVFVLHHTALALVPFYWAARYELLPLTKKFVFHVVWVASSVLLGPHAIVAYVSGLNLMYNLYPPPALRRLALFDHQYYRFVVIAMLILLIFVCYGVIGAFGRFVKWASKKSHTKNKKKTV